jgi:hypothetical protein
VLHPGHANAIARLARRNTGSNRNDFANRFVAECAREVAGRFAASLMHVRVTHPAGADFDEHLVFTGLRHVDFLYGATAFPR